MRKPRKKPIARRALLKARVLDNFHQRGAGGVCAARMATSRPTGTRPNTRRIASCPPWNYEVVHAHCLRSPSHDDVKLVRSVVARLTHAHEAGQPHPWKMGDAPPDYLADSCAHRRHRGPLTSPAWRASASSTRTRHGGSQRASWPRCTNADRRGRWPRPCSRPASTACTQHARPCPPSTPTAAPAAAGAWPCARRMCCRCRLKLHRPGGPNAPRCTTPRAAPAARCARCAARSTRSAWCA